MLADGRITDAEYDRAFARYRQCLGDLGITLGEPTKSPLDGRLVAMPHARVRVSDTAAIGCQEKHVALIEADIGLRPPRLAPAFRSAIRSCLDARGVSVPVSAHDMRDLARAVGDDHVRDLEKCVGDAMPRFYPDLPFYVFSPPGVL